MPKPPLKAPDRAAPSGAPKPHLMLQPIAELIYERTHLDQADAWALAAAILELLQ